MPTHPSPPGYHLLSPKEINCAPHDPDPGPGRRVQRALAAANVVATPWRPVPYDQIAARSGGRPRPLLLLLLLLLLGSRAHQCKRKLGAGRTRLSHCRQTAVKNGVKKRLTAVARTAAPPPCRSVHPDYPLRGGADRTARKKRRRQTWQGEPRWLVGGLELDQRHRHNATPAVGAECWWGGGRMVLATRKQALFGVGARPTWAEGEVGAACLCARCVLGPPRQDRPWRRNIRRRRRTGGSGQSAHSPPLPRRYLPSQQRSSDVSMTRRPDAGSGPRAGVWACV